MQNVIQLTYEATNRPRSEIRFVIGESPVPGLTGKMWLGGNKLIRLPAPQQAACPPVRAQSEQLCWEIVEADKRATEGDAALSSHSPDK